MLRGLLYTFLFMAFGHALWVSPAWCEPVRPAQAEQLHGVCSCCSCSGAGECCIAPRSSQPDGLDQMALSTHPGPICPQETVAISVATKIPAISYSKVFCHSAPANGPPLFLRNLRLLI